jgi:hypothetical protein
MSEETSLLEAALGYVAAGFPVVPLDGKVPRTRHGLTEASTDPEAVTWWWRRWPQANIGIRTGAESGLVVLDVDAQHGGLATTRRARTPARQAPRHRASTDRRRRPARLFPPPRHRGP